MSLPNFKLEKELVQNGYNNIIGLDEVGRGAWAGPVVAAAVSFSAKAETTKLAVNDSKLLSAQERERIFSWLIENFAYGVGVVSPKLVDHFGIVAATKLAMSQAVANLPASPDYLLIDALTLESLASISQRGIIKGDRKVWTIAAASIVAKVTRDRIMDYYHQIYECYGFNRHKGYGTKLHQAMLLEYGSCGLHRQSFRPLMDLRLNGCC
ncbi:MAG: ribonuclease HII [Patescibacteria group bacterium]